MGSADFLLLHEREIRSQRSQSSDARNLLKGRIAAASNPNGRWQPFTSRRRRLVMACLTLLLAAGLTWTIGYSLRSRLGLEATALPRKTLTPGSARAVEIAELCHRQDVDNDPPVDASLKQAVFKEYGVRASSEKDYRLDYLITPALGGVETIQNLWPQPYTSTWNSRVKDQLEDHLHTLVCQGDVQLATAQNDLAFDWIAAYKKYFSMSRPALLERGSASLQSMLGRNHGDRSRSDGSVSAFYKVTMFAPTQRLEPITTPNAHPAPHFGSLIAALQTGAPVACRCVR